MLPLLSINWDPNPELFNLFGHIPVRYYGLFLFRSPLPVQRQKNRR